MPEVQVFWDPQGLTVDTLGSKEYLRTTDGDTPFISLSIRMLSIDAPEVHYPGSSRPSRQDANLAQLAQWIGEGRAPIDSELAAYLQPRLATGKAGTLQEHQGQQASAVFQQMLEQMLAKPNGSRRSLFIRTADQPFDDYGRLLAYIAPNYTTEELEKLAEWERSTFNLLMVRAGWAATMIIYPSLPKYTDLALFHDAAKEAYLAGRGIWADSVTLTGYEFRMAVKLFEVTQKLVSGTKVSSSERNSWVSRYCVDMTTKEIHYPQKYFRVAPYNRLFIWPQDVSDAVGKLNLGPAD